MTTDYKDNYKTPVPLETRIGLHQRFSTNHRGWHRWMLDQLRLRPGMSIVEYGCGTGDLWAAASSEELAGVKLLLLDKSEAMVEKASDKLQAVSDVSVATVDLDGEIVMSGKPDIVIANHVLYHTLDPCATLRSLRNQISDSTRCVFATNGIASMASLSRFLPQRLRDGMMSNLIANFTLETGYQHVRKIFGLAHTVRYPDGLQVTEADPLVSYIQSLPWDLTAPETNDFRDKVTRHICDYGSLFIEKDVGYLSNCAEQ